MIDDRQLEDLATRLGEEAAHRVDAQRTAWAVLARLRASQARARWWRRVGLAPVAAAAAAVLLAVGLTLGGVFGSGSTAPFVAPTELEELDATELAEVLDSLDVDAPLFELVPVGLYDLSESELSALLETMEG